MRKMLGTLLLLFVAGDASAADIYRFPCFVMSDPVWVRCPLGDEGFRRHQAFLYPGMFRGHVIPPGLTPGSTFTCSVDEKYDLADCVVDRKKKKKRRMK